jgi:hypothetical protein
MFRTKRPRNYTSSDPRAKKARFNPTFKILASYGKTNNRMGVYGYGYTMGVYGYTISLSQDALNSFRDYYHKTYLSRGGIVEEHSGYVNLMPDTYKSRIVHSQVGTAASVPLPTIGQDIPTILSSYHSHPPPQDPTIHRSNLTSIPSDKDIISYIANFPAMQVNFIVDINGIYIIDISRALRSTKMDKERLTTFALKQWHRLFVNSNLKRYIDVKSETMFFEKTPELWKHILEFIRATRINITYIDYNDSTELYEFDIDTVVPLENFDRSESEAVPMNINKF